MSYSNNIVVNSPITDGADAIVVETVQFYYLEGETEVIQVERWDYTDPDNPQKVEPFVEGVDYTINEAGYPATEIRTLAIVPSNHKLIIYRETTPTQDSSFANGAFPAESVEDAFDKSVMIAHENRYKLDNQAILQPIGGPTIDIVDLQNRVTTNEADIATNVIDIAANAANISSNDTDIATNAGNIATNTGDIATNTGDIATNAGNIATNTADIATNAADIAALSPPNIVVTSSNYGATSGDVVILQGNNLIVTLPAPTAAHKVIVKLDGSFPGGTLNATINGGGNNVDGAATHVMDSDYGSKTFIADGTNWFII